MVIFLNTFQIPFSLFNYIISNSGYIVKTILQLFAFFCKLFKMKSECHGGLALLFSYPLSYQRGDHFHEPGGIHLILPSLFTYYYTEMVKACQVFSALFCIFLQSLSRRYQVSRQKCAIRKIKRRFDIIFKIVGVGGFLKKCGSIT